MRSLKIALVAAMLAATAGAPAPKLETVTAKTVVTKTKGPWTSWSNANDIRAVALDADGRSIWSAGPGGVTRFDPAAGTFRKFNTFNGLIDGLCYDVAVAPDGAVWVGTFSGVSRYKDGLWKSWALKPAIGSGSPTSTAWKPEATSVLSMSMTTMGVCSVRQASSSSCGAGGSSASPAGATSARKR